MPVLLKQHYYLIFDKYSSADAVDSDDFASDFGGIKDALADRIASEEGKFYPELEKLGY